MAVGLSSQLANGWLDMLRAQAYTAPAAAYIKLHIGDPGAAGTANPAVGDATRKLITFAAAAGGAIAMNGTLPVWTNVTTTETLSHITEWNASTAGIFEFSGALTTPQAWANANTFTLTALTVSLTPIAA